MTTRRISPAAAIVITAIALVAAPAAGANKPERTYVHLDPFIVEDGCPFPVRYTPKGKDQLYTVFDDGRWMVHTHANPTLTNLATGTALVYRLRYTASETTDSAGGSIVGDIRGQFNFLLMPGDEGPSGIDPDGALLHIVGHLRYTADPDTFALTSFSARGKITDVCAELG